MIPPIEMHTQYAVKHNTFIVSTSVRCWVRSNRHQTSLLRNLTIISTICNMQFLV